MNRRARNIKRHPLATFAGALVAVLAGEPIPAEAAQASIGHAAPSAADAQLAAGAVPAPIEGITILEGRWEVAPLTPRP